MVLDPFGSDELELEPIPDWSPELEDEGKVCPGTVLTKLLAIPGGTTTVEELEVGGISTVVVTPLFPLEPEDVGGVPFGIVLPVNAEATEVWIKPDSNIINTPAALTVRILDLLEIIYIKTLPHIELAHKPVAETGAGNFGNFQIECPKM